LNKIFNIVSVWVLTARTLGSHVQIPLEAPKCLKGFKISEVNSELEQATRRNPLKTIRGKIRSFVVKKIG
jgi:hypothetical protein